MGKDGLGSASQHWRDMVHSGDILESEAVERWHTLMPVEAMSLLMPITRCAGVQPL